MSDQNTSAAAAYPDIHTAGHEPVGGTSRRTFVKASGGLISGAAAQVVPAAAAQDAVAADHGRPTS